MKTTCKDTDHCWHVRPPLAYGVYLQATTKVCCNCGSSVSLTPMPEHGPFVPRPYTPQWNPAPRGPGYGYTINTYLDNGTKARH